MTEQELMVSKGNKPRKGTVFTCLCGQLFYRRKGNIKANNYCSKTCYASGLITSTNKKCVVCSTGYRVSMSQEKWRGESKYCSKKCKGQAMRVYLKGAGSSSWKGGITPINKRIRRSKDWQEWREKIFTRDNYTCQDCGVRGGYLEPHHIKPFAYFPDLRFDINNGQTLCRPCHMKTDTFGERAKKWILENASKTLQEGQG